MGVKGGVSGYTTDCDFFLIQHPGLKGKSVPLDSRWIGETEWRAVLNYKPYADYDIPLLLFGDFHGARKAEQNKFLLDVR